MRSTWTPAQLSTRTATSDTLLATPNVCRNSAATCVPCLAVPRREGRSLSRHPTGPGRRSRRDRRGSRSHDVRRHARACAVVVMCLSAAASVDRCDRATMVHKLHNRRGNVGEIITLIRFDTGDKRRATQIIDETGGRPNATPGKTSRYTSKTSKPSAVSASAQHQGRGLCRMHDVWLDVAAATELPMAEPQPAPPRRRRATQHACSSSPKRR